MAENNIPKLAFGTYQCQNIYDATLWALQEGYRHIDTAQFYFNEEEVGRAIQDSEVPRNEIFITSKVWMTRFRDVIPSIQESLTKLRVESIDLMLLHWPVALKNKEGGGVEVDFYPLRSAWEQMEQAHDQGLVKNIGLSNWTVALLIDLLSYARIKPVCNQVELHAHFQQKKLVEISLKLGVTPFAYAPLGAPALTINRPDSIPAVIQDPTVLEVAAKHNATAAQVCIKFLLQRGCGVVVKASSQERIRENFNAQQVQLDDEDMQKLLNIQHTFKYYKLEEFFDITWSFQ